MPFQLIDVWDSTHLDDLPDTRPRPDEQVPHFLVIESINFTDALESELYIECPCDHTKARHWCTSAIYVRPRFRWQLAGAKVEVGFETFVDCFILDDICQVGVHEMMGLVGWRENTAWPADLPQEPGSYPVQWCSEGYGEDHRSWIELLD
jgi:hypothetical protein